jgi:endonuclease-3
MHIAREETHRPGGFTVGKTKTGPAETDKLKKPFDVEVAIERLRAVTASYPKAALFELAAEGFNSVFEILVACIIPIRTYDEVTVVVARRLFSRARTPKDLAGLAETEIDALIHPCTFHGPKARTIRTLARETVSDYGGELPCDPEALLAFRGAGPKCANLTLGILCNLPLISVDIHVHRVTNRWGLVQTTSHVKTMEALQERLPRGFWVEINALLVPFGKHVCTGTRPKCSTCPLLEMCRQVDVTSHR